jgi:hypothetical protein
MAKKKPTKKAAAAKKKPTKRTATAKKAARKSAAKSPRKAAGKAAGKAARKATGKTARKTAGKAAAKKVATKSARKAAPKKAAAKSTRKAGGAQARKAAPRSREPQAREPQAREPQAREPEASRQSEVQAQPEQTVAQAIRTLRAASADSGEPAQLPIEVVETTSAGTQPLAPEHAAVDDLTSSGNELLDIFQKYDRNRTGFLERPGFARLLEALGQNITDEELEMAFDMVDSERTGKISWKQFKNWWTSR